MHFHHIILASHPNTRLSITPKSPAIEPFSETAFNDYTAVNCCTAVKYKKNGWISYFWTKGSIVPNLQAGDDDTWHIRIWLFEYLFEHTSLQQCCHEPLQSNITPCSTITPPLSHFLRWVSFYKVIVAENTGQDTPTASACWKWHQPNDMAL